MKVLLAGWFSFEQMGATAGDLLARDLAAEWLEEAGRDYDVATAAPFVGGVHWRVADPAHYGEVIFVCGPFGHGPPLTEFLRRFDSVPLVGLNLSLLQSLAEWDPFTLLLERDSGRAIRADVSFLSKQPLVPVVGSVLVHPQREYGARALHARAHDALHQLLARRDMAVVEIDTRLDENATGLATPAQVESLIARMNAIVTTRLHGMVLALKNGVPALVVDPVAGGAKIARQARALEWPAVFVADALDPNDLARSLDWCLTADACDQARNAAERARIEVRQVREQFVSALRR
jgi:hypothetical protein